MELDEYKKTEINFKSEEEKNKFYIALAVLVLLVVLVTFFHFRGKKLNENEVSDSKYNVIDPEIQVEMTIVFQKVGEIESLKDFDSKSYHLQFALAVNEDFACMMGLKKARELYACGFKSEALVEYATVAHTLLNDRIKPFLTVNSYPKFFKSINIAHANNIISSEQKDMLHKLRILRNKKVHTPGLNLDKEITELYLNSELNHVDQLFLC